MICLNPQEVFPIVRGLGDHADSSTYYVRAVIRNAKTNELIETVDLEDQGDGHLFAYNWRVPADPSGQGFFITVITSIYTDSGYTTKASTYLEEYDTYLVQDRLNSVLIGGGGGADVDYKKIERMLQQAVKSIPLPEKTQIPKVDLSPVLEGLKKVQEAVSSIHIPVPEPVDLSGVLTRIDQAIAAANDKRMTEEQMQPLQDLHAQMTKLLEANSNESVRSQLEDVVQRSTDALSNVQEFFTKDVDTIMAGIEKIAKAVSDAKFAADIAYLIQNRPAPAEEAVDDV